MLLMSAMAGRAVVLDWTTATWTNGALTGQFNLDGVAGNDVRIDIVSSGVTFVNQYPQNVADPAIRNSTKGLQLWSSAGFTNTTNTVTVTITFLGTYAAGVYANYTLYDVDATTNTFIDRITFSALNGVNPVNLTVTNIGATASNTITGSGGASPVALGTPSVGNVTDTRGDVFVSTGTAAVTSLKFVWNNPGPNFGSQAIDLGNLTFTAIPEVGSGTAALLLCGGLLAFGRLRSSADTTTRT